MILKFKPIFKAKIWGGSKLKTLFNYHDSGNQTGECWGISAHPKGETLVEPGPFKGISLKTIWEEERALFGCYPTKTFPILVKFIDANDDLSIQVHPDDAYAKQFNSYGKTECWYILDAEENASIIIGHAAQTKKAFMSYVQEKRFLELVNETPIKKGDFFYIPAGTIHAIKKGTVLLEVQQSSDITYRFYDYDRLENNRLRPLHLKEACDVVKVPDDRVIRNHIPKYFTFDIESNKGAIKAHQYGDFIIVIEGVGQIEDIEVKKSDFLFVSSQETYRINGNLTYARVTLKEQG